MSNRQKSDSLVAPLEYWAQQTPEAIAVEDTDGRSLTYSALDAYASSLACRFHAMGVGPGDRVGICIPKSINSVICIMGILKARAAYVPVDYSAPSNRNRFIFDNCRTKVICTDEPRAAALTDGEGQGGGDWIPLLVFPGIGTDSIGAAWLDDQAGDWRSDDPFSPDDLSYILYTSGSTGVPKGVVHTHASASSFVNWASDSFEPTGADRFSSHAPFHFDLSILDLYTPQTVGATLVLIGDELGKQPHTLAPVIAEKRISIWYSVPSVLALLAQYGKLEAHDFSNLRTVLFAGEVFPVKHLRELVAKWPERAYYNLYGPTETNVCTFYRIPDTLDPERDIPYPIGPACSNVEAVVLDDEHRPVGPAEEGMLYIRASGPVMREYWQLPELSAAVFYVDPEGRKWYGTGDVVTIDDQGNYLFVGRRDRMVKRHGYRIELGEIEAGLYRCPEIQEAAVIAKALPDGVRIIAFLTAEEEKKLSVIALKQYCAKNLPSYMNPDRFVFLDNLPRTSTDKVDYQALVKQA